MGRIWEDGEGDRVIKHEMEHPPFIDDIPSNIPFGIFPASHVKNDARGHLNS